MRILKQFWRESERALDLIGRLLCQIGNWGQYSIKLFRFAFRAPELMFRVEGSWGWNSNVLAKDRSTDTNVLPLSTDSFSTTLVQLGLENHDRVFPRSVTAIVPRRLPVLLRVSLFLIFPIPPRLGARHW